MKSLKFFYVIFIISISFAHAQREADILIHGRCISDANYNCNVPESNMLFKFDADTLLEIVDGIALNLPTYFSRAAFADRQTGELVFASNGWRLINGSGGVVAEKLWRDDMPHPADSWDNRMVNNSQGPLFLNDPGDSTKAYLFYGQFLRGLTPDQTPFTKADRYFTYAKLDISSQTLVSKNNILINEFATSGGLHACRHANGRDWWVTKGGFYEDELYIGLLSPSGINMQKLNFPNLPHEGQIQIFHYFSADGNRFSIFTNIPGRRLHIFDFNRCTGNFNYVSSHNLQPYCSALDFANCHLSPDGSKFYFRTSQSTGVVEGSYQYDIALDTAFYVMSFGSAPEMAPNYKQILIGSFVTSPNGNIRTISRIGNLDADYSELIVNLHTDSTLNIPTFVAPSSFANFRLGKLAGSACDTIVSGLSEQLKVKSVKVFPNPTQDVLHLEFPYPVGKPYQISIVDVMGKVVYSGNLAAEGGSLSLSSLGLAKGLYVLHAQRDGKGYSRRFVVEN